MEKFDDVFSSTVLTDCAKCHVWKITAIYVKRCVVWYICVCIFVCLYFFDVTIQFLVLVNFSVANLLSSCWCFSRMWVRFYMHLHLTNFIYRLVWRMCSTHAIGLSHMWNVVCHQLVDSCHLPELVLYEDSRYLQGCIFCSQKWIKLWLILFRNANFAVILRLQSQTYQIQISCVKVKCWFCFQKQTTLTGQKAND